MLKPDSEKKWKLFSSLMIWLADQILTCESSVVIISFYILSAKAFFLPLVPRTVLVDRAQDAY